jgi:hypothetical protein
LGFVIWNLNSPIGEEDGRISILEGVSQRTHPLYAYLAHAAGGSVYEGVSPTPKEIFLLRDV